MEHELMVLALLHSALYAGVCFYLSSEEARRVLTNGLAELGSCDADPREG